MSTAAAEQYSFPPLLEARRRAVTSRDLRTVALNLVNLPRVGGDPGEQSAGAKHSIAGIANASNIRRELDIEK
jgi:hypothetical protein